MQPAQLGIGSIFLRNSSHRREASCRRRAIASWARLMMEGDSRDKGHGNVAPAGQAAAGREGRAGVEQGAVSSWQISTSSCSVTECMRTKCRRRGAVFSAEAPVMLDGDSRATGHAGRAAGAALGPISCNCSTRRVASRLLRAISNRARPVPGWGGSR